MADDNADKSVQGLVEMIKSMVKPVPKAASMQVTTCGGPECGRMHFVMIDENGIAIVEGSASPDELEAALAAFRQYLARRGTPSVVIPSDGTMN